MRYTKSLYTKKKLPITPTSSPTDQPSNSPSTQPSGSPTSQPSKNPTKSPSDGPTGDPTISPSSLPTVTPTSVPSPAPTSTPTSTPTITPTTSPTEVCHGLQLSNGPSKINGIYHKLQNKQNNHYQWESRHTDSSSYKIFFDSTQNAWTISGDGANYVLSGMGSSFFEPITNDIIITDIDATKYNTRISCHDVCFENFNFRTFSCFFFSQNIQPLHHQRNPHPLQQLLQH